MKIEKGIDIKDFFNKKFLEALYFGDTNSLFVKNNKLIVILNNNRERYEMDLKLFKIHTETTFHDVFYDKFPNFLNDDKFSEETAICLTGWLNPIMENFDREGFEKYKKDFYSRFDKNGSNYNEAAARSFKQQIYNVLSKDIERKSRREHIERLLPYKMFDFAELVELEYYTDIPSEQTLNLYRNEEGEFSEDTKNALENLSIIGLQKLAERKNKASVNKIRKYIEFVENDVIIDMAISGNIPYNYLEYSNLKKEDLVSVQYEVLILILESMNKFPERLRITSQDILDEYGKSINGSKFYKLAIYGYIDDRHIIEIIEKNKVLRLAGEPEENLFGDDEVFAYYSDYKLAEMFLNVNEKTDERNIDLSFVNKYKKALNDEDLFNKKSRNVIKQIKMMIMINQNIPIEEKDSKFQSDLLDAFNIGLCTSEVLKENLSTEYIENQYLDGNITDDYILNLYIHGVLENEIIQQYFSNDEMIDLYLEGKLDKNIFSVMDLTDETREKILENIIDEKMPVDDVLSLYFSGIFSVEYVEYLIEFLENDVEFLSYINEETDFSKIKELFERKIIDYNCVTNLRESEIITDEQLEELKRTMDKDRFFNDIKGRTFTLVTDRKSRERIGKSGKNIDRDYKTQTDKSKRYKKEQELIAKILGIDGIGENLEEYATIESYNQNGKATSLNGYRVFGSRDNGLVIFAKFQRENAVFIMPFYQAAYFLNAKGEDNMKDVVIGDRMKDKAYLKTLSQVAVIPHTEYFARNLTSAACTLSPEFNEKFNMDNKYQLEVQELCENMRTDYRKEKGIEK